MNLLNYPQDIRPLPYVALNLFLAAIPVAFAFLAAYLIRRNLKAGRRPVDVPVVVLLLVWAGFLPNTAYLLTEWRHYIVTVVEGGFYPQVRYSHSADIRLLLSTAFFVVYSGSGIVAFFLSVWPLDRIVREHSVRVAAVVRLAVFLLCALGVYLGLIHRFNTVDLVNPSKLPSILHTTATIVTRRFVIALIVALTAILWILYEAFDVWMDGLSMRLARRKRDDGLTEPTPAR